MVPNHLPLHRELKQEAASGRGAEAVGEPRHPDLVTHVWVSCLEPIDSEEDRYTDA